MRQEHTWLKCKGQSNKWHRAGPMAAVGIQSLPEDTNKPLLSLEVLQWGEARETLKSRIHLFGASELRMSALGIWKQEKRVLELLAIHIFSWSSFLEKAVTSKKRVKHEPLWTFNHLFNWLIEPKAELKALLALIIVIIIILISLNNPPINQLSLERLSNESFPRSHSLEMEELEHYPIWSQSLSP